MRSRINRINMPDDVEILTREPVHRGFARIERLTLKHRLHQGGWSEVLERELYDRSHVIAVLPYDPHTDRVLLLRRFRIGAWATGFPAWQIEIVADMIDADEAPEQVARREAREEADLEIGALEPIAHYISSPGTSSETVRRFCGRVDTSIAGGVHGLKLENEDIEVITCALSDIPATLANPAAGNGLTVITLQWLMLNRERLRFAWLNESKP
jgi:ADP-ribose pyrophosphatase